MKRLICTMLIFLLALLPAAQAYSGDFALPAGLKVIAREAFLGSQSIRDVIIPSGTERIESRAFAASSLERIKLPESLNYIAPDAFENCGDGLILQCEADSYARKYCEANGLYPFTKSEIDLVLLEAGSGLGNEMAGIMSGYECAAKVPVNLQYQSASSAAMQAAQAENAAANGADVVILEAIDVQNALAIADVLDQYGVPLLFVSNDPGEEIEAYGSFFVGMQEGCFSDARALAAAASELAMNRMLRGSWLRGSEYTSENGWSLYLPGVSVVPQLQLKPDRESVEVGETITAVYEITGGYEPAVLNYSWLVTTGSTTRETKGVLENPGRRGELSFTPAYGSSLQLIATVQDAQGGSGSWDSGSIAITGDTVQPPEVSIRLDHADLKAGETITATYEITGSNDLAQLTYSWVMITGETQHETVTVLKNPERSGVLSFTPETDGGLKLVLELRDIDGRYYRYESEVVAVSEPDYTLPELRVYLNQESVNVGEAITATYEIIGGNKPAMLKCVWTMISGNVGISAEPLTFENPARSGELSFTPTLGERLVLQISAVDSAGNECTYANEDIIITGYVPEPLEISVVYDRESVNAGETITATYEITGGADLSSIGYMWRSINGDDANIQYITDNNPQRSGTLSFTPVDGDGLTLEINVSDILDNNQSYTSPVIPVSGFEVEPLSIRVNLDRESVNAGETITASYEITGGAELESLSYLWAPTNGSEPIYITMENPERSGTLSFTPDSGNALSLQIDVKDAKGESISYVSDSIPIIGGEPTVSVRMDRESVNLGETITASYEITGGAQLQSLGYVWISQGGPEPELITLENPGRSGSLSYVPVAGDGVMLQLIITDIHGNVFPFMTDSIPVIREELAISVNFDKTIVAVDEPITATYEITGGVEPLNMGYVWICTSSSDSPEYVEISDCGRNGTLSFVPSEAGALILQINVLDANKEGCDFSMDELVVID